MNKRAFIKLVRDWDWKSVKSKRMKLVPWLVENGADINFEDSFGYSALHHAVKRKHNMEQVEELLSCGAIATQRARDGSSPLSIARRLGRTKLIALLERFV
jgi:uncharacterized protein